MHAKQYTSLLTKNWDPKVSPRICTRFVSVNNSSRYLENVIAKLKANAQASQVIQLFLFNIQSLPFPYNLYSSFANPTPQVQVEENAHQLPPTHDTNANPPSQQPVHVM